MIVRQPTHIQRPLFEMRLQNIFVEGPSEGVDPLQKDARQTSVQDATQIISRSLLWCSMAQKTFIYKSYQIDVRDRSLIIIFNNLSFTSI